ncbi:MAG TPA: hypothetical protein VN132_16030 [Bdellovibrio sp.]|nr:hypothetical protein [Bdellovibrio sp.]
MKTVFSFALISLAFLGAQSAHAACTQPEAEVIGVVQAIASEDAATCTVQLGKFETSPNLNCPLYLEQGNAFISIKKNAGQCSVKAGDSISGYIHQGADSIIYLE